MILHLNIRSVNKNFDELHKFLVSFRLRLDIVCLNEIRIKHEPLINIIIREYNFFKLICNPQQAKLLFMCLIILNAIYVLINT